MFPSFFVAHGAPTLAIEQNEYVDFLKTLASSLPRPKAIVIFSAHWESGIQLVSDVSEYGTIYDFYGFPDELYRKTYPAKGDASLAREIVELFHAEGIKAELDTKRGLDHGAWVPLELIYPEVDIPVVALSVNPALSAKEQYQIGKALAPLREKDVLVIGSGGTVHNLRRLNWGSSNVEDWAKQFDEWLADGFTKWNTEELFEYETNAPYAKDAVPTPEHFIPVLLAMGAADNQRVAKRLHQSYQLGSLSLASWQFGE